MVESEKVKPSFYRVNEKVQIGEMDYVWKMNIYIYIYTHMYGSEAS